MRFILKPVKPYRKLQRFWDDTGTEISRQIAQKTAVLKLEAQYGEHNACCSHRPGEWTDVDMALD